MFHHTATRHDGIIVPDKGGKYYKFHITGQFTDNLTRQTDEGRRQTQMEKFQTEKKLTVLNSKIDFCQPMRTNLAVITKSDNIIPGQLDRQPTITIKEPDRQKNRQTRNISDRRIAKGRRNTNQTEEIEERNLQPIQTSTPTKTNTVTFNYSTASFSPIRKKRKLDPAIVDNQALKPG